MKKNILKISLPLIIIFFIGFCKAQQTDINAERIKIKSISTKIDSLTGLKNVLSDSADLLSIKIKSLTSREPGRKEHNQLEKLMRKSHELSKQEENINNEIKLLSTKLIREREIFTVLLQNRIDSLIVKLEKSDDEKKPEITWQISSLIAEKHALNSVNFKSDIRKIPAVKILPRPWDSPAGLRLKSSMLLDRSEKLQEQAKDIRKLIKELERERKVRERVSELTKDLALFDENEERVLSGTGAINQNTGTLDYNGEELKSRDAASVKITEDAPIPSGSIPSSPVKLKTFIKEMKLYVKRISAVSDSLKQSADNFEKLARLREKHE